MNFDLIGVGKPGGEKLMRHDFWICFKTESHCIWKIYLRRYNRKLHD